MSEITAYYGGETIEVDEEGFLIDATQWNIKMVSDIADTVDITMSEKHWEVVEYIRHYFESNHAVPELRFFLRHLREKYGKEAATRKYVYRLFPYGYGQQMCKIAGMRKPRKLMLDV